jgi:hypothetical protein
MRPRRPRGRPGLATPVPLWHTTVAVPLPHDALHGPTSVAMGFATCALLSGWLLAFISTRALQLVSALHLCTDAVHMCLLLPRP